MIPFATLVDRIFSSPFAFVSGCLVWIPLCLWVVSLVHWMVQGEVDVLWGILGLFTAILLGMLTMQPPKPELAPFLFIGVVLTTILFPVFRSSLSRRSLDAIDVEAIEDAYEMLRIKPDNHVMRFKLAKLLYKRGMRGSGIAFAEQALPHLPTAGFFEEHRDYQSWKRSNPHVENTLVCLECGAQNPTGTFECRQCGAEYLLDHIHGRWVGGNASRKLLAVWAAVMLTLIGIPLALMQLEHVLAAGVSVMLSVAALGILISGFRRKTRS